MILVGIRTGGAFLAQRLADRISRRTGKPMRVGVLDITLYRDDWTQLSHKPLVGKTELPGSIDDQEVVLVDDVLFTGRTVRAALDALIDYGRPRQDRTGGAHRPGRPGAAHPAGFRGPGHQTAPGPAGQRLSPGDGPDRCSGHRVGTAGEILEVQTVHWLQPAGARLESLPPRSQDINDCIKLSAAEARRGRRPGRPRWRRVAAACDAGRDLESLKSLVTANPRGPLWDLHLMAALAEFGHPADPCPSWPPCSARPPTRPGARP